MAVARRLGVGRATERPAPRFEGYEGSTSNLAQTSLETDNVFSDGYSLQMATVTGTVESGLTATLNVPV